MLKLLTVHLVMFENASCLNPYWPRGLSGGDPHHREDPDIKRKGYRNRIQGRPEQLRVPEVKDCRLHQKCSTEASVNVV